MQSVSVIIPAHNEEDALGPELDHIRKVMDASGYPFEIIVVDDGSPDRTAEIARSKGVRLLQHRRKRGAGASRRTGILHAHGEICVMIDADGSYKVEDIPNLLACFPDADQVVGARRVEAGSAAWLRRPTKWFIRQLASLLTGTHIPDLNSGLRAFRRDVMLKFLYLIPDGFSCVTTMTLTFLSNGYVVEYVPTDYYPRVGRSKFHPIKDSYNYLLTVVRIVLFFNPMKFFLPASILLFLAGVARFLYHALANHHVRESDVMLILTAFILGAIGLLADLIVSERRRALMDSPEPGQQL